MKEFLKNEFGTDKIQHINEDELKKRIQGESIIDRLKYRKQVGLVNMGRKSIVQKGQKVVIEEQDADHLAKDLRHDEWGFQNLKYSVSEASGSLKIKINNKKKQKAEIGIKTVEIAEGGAKPGKDYDHVEKVIQFSGNPHQTIEVKIHDDDNWEPDRDFKLVLFDPKTQEELDRNDTKAVVTIIDDDKPGFLSFQEKRSNIKHVSTEEECVIVVDRTNGSDGRITCQFQTVELKEMPEHRRALAGVHFEHQEGELVFEH